jgi:predicted aspartyl protease
MHIPLLLAAVLAHAQTDAPVVVPFRVGDDAIIVDARVNGKQVSLMFDTGFGGTAVIDTAIDVGPQSGTMTLRDFVGELEAPTVKLKGIVLGGRKMDVDDDVIIQQSQEGMSFAYGQHVDGIMGFSVIKNNITEINFEKHEFRIYPKSFDINKLVPDNKRTFMAKLLPIGVSSMEMEVLPPSGKRMTLALDTGNAFYATTHKDVLERVGLWDETKDPKYTTLSGVASGSVESWALKMPAMNIFGVPVPSSVWDVIDRPSGTAEGDGTVGFGFLKNFNIIMDYEHRRVWLENFTGKTGNDPSGEVGIFGGLEPNSRKTLVGHVMPGSPAEAAGIKVGDEILAVDDNEIHSLTSRRLRALLDGDIGSKVRIAISRNGELKRYTLERKALVN